MSEANSIQRIVRPVTFRGYDFDAERVVAVDPVECHSTGSLACDWEYGVRVRLEGAKFIIYAPKPHRYGYAGDHTSRDSLKREANAMREALLKKIWPKPTDSNP